MYFQKLALHGIVLMAAFFSYSCSVRGAATGAKEVVGLNTRIGKLYEFCSKINQFNLLFEYLDIIQNEEMARVAITGGPCTIRLSQPSDIGLYFAFTRISERARAICALECARREKANGHPTIVCWEGTFDWYSQKSVD